MRKKGGEKRGEKKGEEDSSKNEPTRTRSTNRQGLYIVWSRGGGPSKIGR